LSHLHHSFKVRDDKRLARWIAAKESRWFKPKITEHELVLPVDPEQDEATARDLLFDQDNSNSNCSVNIDGDMLPGIDAHLGAGLNIGLGLNLTREGGVIDVASGSAAAAAGP